MEKTTAQKLGDDNVFYVDNNDFLTVVMMRRMMMENKAALPGWVWGLIVKLSEEYSRSQTLDSGLLPNTQIPQFDPAIILTFGQHHLQ